MTTNHAAELNSEDAVLLTSYEHSIIERMANFEEPIVLHLTDGTVAYLYITSHA